MLATLKPADVDPNASQFDYDSFKSRIAARTIVFDDNKVALIYIRKHNYYMLPGGGIDDNDIAAGLSREIMEELGCKVEIMNEIGTIEIYFDRWKQKQTDHCYIARKISDDKDISRTDFEIEEGHDVIWVPSLGEAIKLVKDASPENRDGKLVRSRDLRFLEEVIRNR
jgi:8-oxo-dGTP pyrophosphatase MutT (NUDIX family)